MSSFYEWINPADDNDPGEGNTTKHWRYSCPYCKGNAYTGILGKNTRFRGSAKCEMCNEGFAACAKEYKQNLRYAGEGYKCKSCNKQSGEGCGDCPFCGGEREQLTK